MTEANEGKLASATAKLSTGAYLETWLTHIAKRSAPELRNATRKSSGST